MIRMNMIEKLRIKSWRTVAVVTMLVSALVNGVAMAAPVPQAQESTMQHTAVTGQVLDENGEPVIGATVNVKGTNVTAVTDIDGRFSLRAAQGATLEVRYLGYAAREVKVDGTGKVTISLEQIAARDLSEVVVTALGIKKEAKSLSYNVPQDA